MIQGYKLRTAQDADWPVILNLANATAPRKAFNNLEWLSNRQNFPVDRLQRRHYLIDNPQGEAVAYGAIEGSDNGWYRLFLVMEPVFLQAEPGDILYRQLMTDLRELGAEGAWCREETKDIALLSYLQQRGFNEFRRDSTGDGLEFVIFRRPVERVCQL